MQRLFFHNRHDKTSIEILANLEDVTVYDAFDRSAPWFELFRLTVVPYLIDKQFVLLTSGPYYTGEFALQIQCQDYQGNPLSNSDTYYVSLDGEDPQDIAAVDGIIEITIQCDTPTLICLEITDDTQHGYLPWAAELEVVAYVPSP